MLALNTRHQYLTLADAITFMDANEKPALIYLETGREPVTISRAQFCDSVARVAAGLRELGIQPRDLVIIADVQNLDNIFTFWGAIMMGAIPSMFPTLTEKLDPDVYRQSIGKLVELSGAQAVLTAEDFVAPLAEHVACPVYSLRGLTPHPPTPSPIMGEGENIEPQVPVPSVAEGFRVRGQDIALLQHSSGTTGLQKGVALSHEAILNQLASYSDSLQLSQDDVIVSWLPLYHDMGLIAGFLLPLMQGVPLVLMSPFDWVKHPAMLFKAIHDYRGTLCWLPNFAYNHCARRIRQRDLEGLSLATMRAFINCSEPVRADSHDLFMERFGVMGFTREKLTVSYAMAENVFAVTQTPIGQLAQLDVVDARALEQEKIARPAEGDSIAITKVSCGVAIQNTRIKVVDENGAELPERRVGQLAVSSDCMLTEYHNRPDLNPFVDGWYLTGDMGYIADGEVYVIGRQKDLIINAGKNVYPQDLEAIANTVSGVHPGRVVAFGIEDAKEGTELIAIVAEVDNVVSDEQRRQIESAIRVAVAQQSTVTVTYVHLVDDRWLLKTSSGKIARAANRDKWLAEREE